MSDVAIQVENLSKRYRLGQFVGYQTLRESLVNVVSAPFHRLRSAVTDRRPESGNHDSRHIWALKDVSFEVKRGETIGIIGRNGSGKTTLLKVLSQITEPTQGHARIRGQVVSLLEVGTGFHPELTGRENIYLNGAVLGMKKKEIDRKFADIVEFSEVERFIDTPLKRYSSGMQVRLAFSVAAHLQPEILLVDEVLAVGDAQFQKKCLGKMGDVRKEGRTVLFVSHNMAAVQTLCERTLLLEEGFLRMDGSSHQVVRHYLGDDGEYLGMRLWEDTDRAPGDERLRLHSISILDGCGRVSPDIRTDHDFLIEVKYLVKRDGLRVGATAVVFNREGTCVFSSISNREEAWHGKPHPAGLYRSTCHVPKFLLADGEYSLTIILWEGNYNLICREDDVARFHIVDAGEVRVDYFGGWAGVVRPLLQWNTEKVLSP